MNVTYSSNSLTIVIPTNNPEETHQLLMQGLTISLRHHICCEEKRKSDEDGLITLADFLQVILPSGKRLSKL